MAEPTATAEPSFLDKIGNLLIQKGIQTGILSKGIPLDETAPVGAVAPSAARDAAAAPAVVASPVASVSPQPTTIKDTAIAEANARLQTASKPEDYIGIANLVKFDPDLTKAAMLRYQNSEKGQELAKQTLDKVTAAGGMATPKGRLAYANLWQNADNAPQYGQAFVQYALGNVNAAKKLLSGGAINEKTQINTDNGDLIKYGVDQNGDYHWARNETTGQQLSPDDFSKVVGKLGTLDQSKKYIVEKENASAWAKQANEDYKTAGTVAAAAPSMQTGYEQLKQMGDDLKNSGLPPEALALVFKYTNNTLGLSQSRRQALERLKQDMSSGNTRENDDVSAAIAAALNIPGAKFGADGKTVSANGKSYTIQALENNTSTSGVNSDIEKSFTQSQEDFAKYALASGLAQKDPTGQLQFKFTQALALAKSLAQKEATLPSMPFAIPTVGFGVTDEFKRARIQAEQGIFTQQANAAYGEYVKDIADKSAAGSPPRPGDLQAGFAASPQYKNLLKEYKQKADAIVREPREFLPNTVLPAAGAESAVAPSAVFTPLVGQFPASKDAQKQPAGSAKPTEKSAEAQAAELEAKKAAARKAAKEAAAAAAKK